MEEASSKRFRIQSEMKRCEANVARVGVVMGEGQRGPADLPGSCGSYFGAHFMPVLWDRLGKEGFGKKGSVLAQVMRNGLRLSALCCGAENMYLR